MNRRDALKSLGLITLTAPALLELEGCNVLSDLETWVPVGLSAFDGIAAIVDSSFTSVATTVNALWAAVQNAIDLYNHSTDPQNTKLDKVIAALDALSGGLTQAVAALPIGIPTSALNAAKLGLALLIGTLKGIRNKLQPAAPATAQAVGVIRASDGTLIAPIAAKNARDFKNQFNQIMENNGQSFRVK